MEFGQAPIPATPFVTADDELSKALIKMVGKPGADAVLLEALTQANADLAKRPSARRAIVSLNIEPSNELSLNPNAVRDAFRKSGAQLWALSLQSRDISIKASETNNYGKTSAAVNAGNLTASRNAILQDFAKATGGYRDTINAQSAMSDVRH